MNGVDEVAETNQNLGGYLGQITPLARDLAAARSAGVRIMTMYSSKGPTVAATVIPALEDGVIPLPDLNLGEERRLLYVAMTRSTRFLFGTFARQRRGPTARAGRAQVGQRRQVSSLLSDGPVRPQDGATFLNARFR